MSDTLAPLYRISLPLMLGIVSAPVLADSPPVQPPASAVFSYADLADLADSAPLVVRAQPRKVVAVEPERARGLKPGWGRFYVEARTEAVIAGTVPLGGDLRYLVDLPLDAKGKPPAFKKKSVVLFARAVPSRPGELQLVRPDAQLLWDGALDIRLRGILKEIYAPGAPHRITGVREAIHVGGDLAGEGETQLFLSAANGEPAAITVSRSPGRPVRWAVSFSEVVTGDAVPQRDSLGWYRLACFLPAQLPAAANISPAAADRTAAARDYAFVMQQLGPCLRNRK
ncbi:MAG TPA: hypothetical protein PK680_00710 [Novosphingobium sp.]|nr:hypothetical protein [Novosphingobium sp.]HQA16879.1 hypothetical protein [Novosphingobium sp.]